MEEKKKRTKTSTAVKQRYNEKTYDVISCLLYTSDAADD